MTGGAPSKWDDLATRMGSGAVLIAVGLLGIWLGGIWFHAMIALICGAMIWELVRMLSPDDSGVALGLGLGAGTAVLLAGYLTAGLALPLLLAPALVGFGLIARQRRGDRSVFMAYSVMVMLAGFGMTALRDGFGFEWMLWLVLVVAITDVAGYFAGRALGGPKFWPAVSPKKTWSGTVAGWIGGAAVGALFALFTDAGADAIGISLALSMASQMGDIAESAIKRRAGVKDSSALIPGHGGLLDRFDGMLGASVFLLLTQAFIAFPPGV